MLRENNNLAVMLLLSISSYGPILRTKKRANIEMVAFANSTFLMFSGDLLIIHYN
jgi:hypothetical protein